MYVRSLGKLSTHWFGLFSALVIFSYCSQYSPEASNESTLVLQSLLNYSSNPSAACKSSMQEAEDCLKTSSDLSGSGEVEISGLFSGGTVNSYETYCSQLLAQEQMSGLNSKTQECIFNCNEAYWSRVGSENDCSGEGSEFISNSGVETLGCVRNCKELYSSEPEL
ncbi:hypothetical protein CH352_12310 [Leptospira hartskeerlii]|uniref:Uncharacterized protein n=1 Tax=Leptospira hartskeerlii TaxID=2023177 RepID=A0A2M9XB76_9LEPT|nr:hypothetical protein [Leptospira hartskeerlii]PJZ24802.1 hypothetical protein CH357_14570 [Leptospira hartskeerlii]PJZ33105.1 hypothetical protein CH352_12310 [Leptospira hartskeerlii]